MRRGLPVGVWYDFWTVRRLGRIFFNVLVTLSLLLFVISVVLWVRGYFVSDLLFWQRFEDEVDRSYWIQNVIRSGRGGVGMNRIVQAEELRPGSGLGWARWRTQP